MIITLGIFALAVEVYSPSRRAIIYYVLRFKWKYLKKVKRSTNSRPRTWRTHRLHVTAGWVGWWLCVRTCWALRWPQSTATGPIRRRVSTGTSATSRSSGASDQSPSSTYSVLTRAPEHRVYLQRVCAQCSPVPPSIGSISSEYVLTAHSGFDDCFYLHTCIMILNQPKTRCCRNLEVEAHTK